MAKALPSTCCAVRVTTCRRSRRLHLHGLFQRYICVVLPVFALSQASSCTAGPFIFWGSSLANGHDLVVPRSAPVLAAVGAFITIGSAMRFVTGVVHSYFTSTLGTRIATREDLSPPALRPCLASQKILQPTSKQLLHSRTSSGYVDLR